MCLKSTKKIQFIRSTIAKIINVDINNVVKMCRPKAQFFVLTSLISTLITPPFFQTLLQRTQECRLRCISWSRRSTQQNFGRNRSKISTKLSRKLERKSFFKLNIFFGVPHLDTCIFVILSTMHQS